MDTALPLPLVSIITVTYNAEAYVQKTIESVLQQTYPRVQLIIVDGASTDKTLDIVRSFGHKITLISEPDRGIYDAMNKGISLASGEWINFLNGGDEFCGPETLLSIFANSPVQGVDFIYGDSINTSPAFRKYIKARGLSWKSLHRGLGACHQSMFVRKAIAPFYDIRYRYKAEYNWVLDIFQRIQPGRIRYIPAPVVYYALGGYSESGLVKNLKEFIRITRRRFGWIQIFLNIPVYATIWLRYIKYKFIGYGV